MAQVEYVFIKAVATLDQLQGGAVTRTVGYLYLNMKQLWQSAYNGS